MTCEVVVMNTRGVAMAADSAVALGDGEKIYRNAEKLMQLAPAAPVTRPWPSAGREGRPGAAQGGTRPAGGQGRGDRAASADGSR